MQAQFYAVLPNAAVHMQMLRTIGLQLHAGSHRVFFLCAVTLVLSIVLSTQHMQAQAVPQTHQPITSATGSGSANLSGITCCNHA